MVISRTTVEVIVGVTTRVGGVTVVVIGVTGVGVTVPPFDTVDTPLNISMCSFCESLKSAPSIG